MEQYQKDKDKTDITELKGEVKLLHSKIDTIENNHLAHIKKDIDRILYVLEVDVINKSQFYDH